MKDQELLQTVKKIQAQLKTVASENKSLRASLLEVTRVLEILIEDQEKISGEANDLSIYNT